MASPQPVPTAKHSDRDLASMAEARTLARRAKQAQAEIAELSQERIDAIVDAMAAAIAPHCEALARLAVDETGYGVVADKIQKNLFSADRVYRFIRPMKTVGVLQRLEDRKVIEIAEPFGVVAAIVPSTNPTSTAIYKILIALKARCAIVISPHPSAVRCITRVAEIMNEAARGAGAPEGSINWMTTVTLEGTQELMKSRDVAVILATGGMGLVRAAYSSGKPAYGVGPGNAPCYIEGSADIRKAASDIVIGKTFDNGLLCSSPNSVVVDAGISEELKRELMTQGAYFLSPAETDAVTKVVIGSQRLPNPAIVGRPATLIAEKAGLSVPAATRVLIAPLAGVGRDFPLSIEKLCPVLSWYVVQDWREGCERCKEILGYGGMGHTMSIHSRNDRIILEFGLKKPAFRIVVNTPTTHGSVGMTTGLDPAMTLGCGGWGGNITSDNISPKHLLNIKRLAYELIPAKGSSVQESRATAEAGPSQTPPAMRTGLSPEVLGQRIDQFLASRGIPAPSPVASANAGSGSSRTTSVGSGFSRTELDQPVRTDKPVEFVCEEDVRQAVRSGQKIVVGSRTIVTPAARDLGEEKRVFVEAR
ncbi:MAG TPA: aldehyde dehydrogenase family protein [Vicinamibacterales bacterium]|nr:aldehyde dehydrogenase family protein [Vicinamibacterales bacterium]